jgi:hypothetical protein
MPSFGTLPLTAVAEVVTSLDHLEVVPTVCASPLRTFLLGWKFDGVFKLHMTGDASPVPEFQAQRPFSGTPEPVLEQLLAELKLDATHEGLLTDVRRRDQLIITLMLHYIPDLDVPCLGCGAAALIKLFSYYPPATSPN